MRKTFIRAGTGSAQVAFKLVMLAHLRIALIDLSAFSVSHCILYRIEPAAEKIRSKAYNYFSSIEPVCRNSSAKATGLIGQQHACIRNSICLYVTAAGVFGEELADDLFGRRRNNGAAQQHNRTACSSQTFADCFIDEFVSSLFVFIPRFS